MKTINVSQAEGQVLDWLVAKAKGDSDDALESYVDGFRCADEGAYSTDWAQGGPIIEREGVNLSIDYQDDALSNDMVQLGWKGNLWNNSVPGTAGFLQWAYGPTPLIAAMRCFVASKLGETVEVPEELT